ncbi:hypothetical protein KEC56_00740 [Microbacterium sp. YMB-B2]|uniref:Uncharacterized protein n=1 Tax=Microbacterium tenebrionis TaxID=2830665 RepID=A0A9X1LLV5_9MICO|nr:hypothetical protein [Microbacterium tenebrionis]MCC2028066.1 hypothetical protein [Microbacterium tenebrionis]
MPLSEAAVGPVRIAWADAADDRRATSRRLLTELLSSLPEGRETGDDATADEIVQRCPNCGSAGHGPLRTASGRAVVRIAPDRVRLQRAAKAPWTRRAVLDGTTFYVADAPAPTGFVISVAIVERSGQGRGSAR